MTAIYTIQVQILSLLHVWAVTSPSSENFEHPVIENVLKYGTAREEIYIRTVVTSAAVFMLCHMHSNHYVSVCVINGLSIRTAAAGFVAAYQHLKFVLICNGPVAALLDLIISLGVDLSESSNCESRIGG